MSPLVGSMATEAEEAAVERCEVKEGEVVTRDDSRWGSFALEVGDLLEVRVAPETEGDPETRVALLVTGVKEKDLVEGRYLGSSNEEVAKHCVNKINRKGLPIHLCREDPCEHRIPEVAIHVNRLSWWRPEKFPGLYLRNWGTQVLKEWMETGIISKGGRRQTRLEIPKPSLQRRKDQGKGKAPFPCKAEGELAGKRNETVGWKRKRTWRPRWRPRQVEAWPIERSTCWTSREASRSWEARRTGGHGCRGLVGWTRGWRRLRLCGGPSSRAGVSVRSHGSLHLSHCSGTRREARGYKRWYLEREEARGEESESEEEEEEEGPWPVEPIASGCGVATEEKSRREEKEGKEKQELRIQRGKGVGEAVRRKEEEAKEGRGQPGSVRERLERVRRERGRQLEFRLPDVGAFAEEELEATRGGAEDVDSARPPNAGSDSGLGGRRLRGDHGWREDGHLLQPADPTLPSSDKPRHEGASLPLNLHRRAEGWETGGIRGQPGLEVPGSSQCSERRRMEDGPAFGITPFGRGSVGAHAIAAPSSSSLEAGSQKPGKGRKRARLEEDWRQRVVARGVAGWQREERRKRERQRPWQRRLWQAGQLARLAKRSWRQRKLVGEEQRERRKGREQGEERRQVTLGHSPSLGHRYDRGEEASEVGGETEKGRDVIYKRGEEASRWKKRGGVRSLTEMRGEESRCPEVVWGSAFEFMAQIAEVGSSLGKLGCCMAWMICQAEIAKVSSEKVTSIWGLLAGFGAGPLAVHRSQKKGAYPLRLGELHILWEALVRSSLQEVTADGFVEKLQEDAWLFCCVQYCNFQAGCRSFEKGRWRSWERRVVTTLRNSVVRTLAQDGTVERSVGLVEKELSSRFLSYTGEEIPKLEVLTIGQVEPSLPPASHGGAISASNWVRGRTKEFLEHPEDCVRDVVEDEGLPKLQARVHIESDDRVGLAKLLVERGICGWTEESDLSDGRPVLRLIMNLIPSNAVMQQMQGSVAELPMVTQYLSISLDENETLLMSQSDMTAAFYLFGLGDAWMRYLCFNLAVDGKELGKVGGRKYFLSCKVLPMGWSSAVSVMQEISQNLLFCFGLPKEEQVRKTRGLPLWLCDALGKSSREKRCWWHIYLDNFFAGEKCKKGESGDQASGLHAMAEKAWATTGVISSEKKQISVCNKVDELGARFGGEEQFLGASGERLVKIIQTTAVVLSKVQVPKKWLQVVTGRWIHVLQFRRSGMSTLHLVWRWISGKRMGGRKLLKAREELFMMMLGAPLFHTFLGAQVSGVTTCSDASGKGGAVASSNCLTKEGKDFTHSQRGMEEGLVDLPQLLVLSLFNGIGGAFRCYDVLGVQPGVLVSCEIDASANRVVFRRWPHAKQVFDVRSIDEKMVRKWLFEFPLITIIHLWAGFPCVDLSSVKFGRKNLQGSESSLFFEILRILRIIRRVFGEGVKVTFFIENVASMDKSALEEISQHLGVKPFRVQCSDVVPISRPRLCWTDEDFYPMPGLKIKEKNDYFEITAEGRFPDKKQWLREGCEWPGEQWGTVFPTCMKNIKRRSPPPAPAGIDRADYDTVCRWRSDDFRYPPISIKRSMLFLQRQGNGDSLILQNVKFCMVMGLDIRQFVGPLHISNKIEKGMRVVGAAKLVTVSAFTPL